MSFTRTQHVKAVRKPRRCIWCGEMIAVGEPAIDRAYHFEGDFQHDSLHPECMAAMKAVPPIDIEDGFEAYEWARGRDDDRKGEPPLFAPDGTRLEVTA